MMRYGSKATFEAPGACFDYLKVAHIETPEVQSDDYYPFGLAFNSYQSGLKNDYLYNDGAERQDDLDLNIDLTRYRAYDPAIGRWWQIDPKSDGLVDWTPYNYSFNNPIRYNDPNGDCPPWICGKSTAYKALRTVNEYSNKAIAIAKSLRVDVSINGDVTSGAQLSLQHRNGAGATINFFSVKMASVDQKVTFSSEGIEFGLTGLKPNSNSNDVNIKQELSFAADGVGVGFEANYTLSEDSSDPLGFSPSKADLNVSAGTESASMEASYDLINNEGSVQTKLEQSINVAIGFGFEGSVSAEVKYSTGSEKENKDDH